MMRDLIILIKRLFGLQLSRKDASWVFENAAKRIESGRVYYMCLSLSCPKELLEDFGFSRDRYINFVKEKYPELEGDLTVAGFIPDPYCVWIKRTPESEGLVRKSKVEFLRFLSREANK